MSTSDSVSKQETSQTNEERITSELELLAANFAEVYVTKGLREGGMELGEILTKALRYNTRTTVMAFRTALAARGVQSVRGLLH